MTSRRSPVVKRLRRMGWINRSTTRGINNHGDVVGTLPLRFRYDDARPGDPLRTPGFVYLDGGDEGPDVLVDLDDAVVVGTAEGDLAKWQDAFSIAPTAINDSGEICGEGEYLAFVLTPVIPDP